MLIFHKQNKNPNFSINPSTNSTKLKKSSTNHFWARKEKAADLSSFLFGSPPPYSSAMNTRKRSAAGTPRDTTEKKTLTEELALSRKKAEPENSPMTGKAEAIQAQVENKDWFFYKTNTRVSTSDGRACRMTSIPSPELMAVRTAEALIGRHDKVGWVEIARAAMYSNDWHRLHAIKQKVKAPEFWLEICRHDAGFVASYIPFGPGLTRLDVLLAAVSSFSCGYCGFDDLWSDLTITADQNHPLLFNTWIDRALELTFVETEKNRCGTTMWIEEQNLTKRVFEINPVTNRPVFIVGEREYITPMEMEICDLNVTYMPNWGVLNEREMADNHLMKMFVFLERIRFNEFLGLYWERKSRPRSPFPVLIDRLFSILCGRFNNVPRSLADE